MISAQPVEAATLRAAFLAFVGKRTIAEVCRFYGLPYFVVQRWVSHGAELPPWLEKQMVEKLWKTCQSRCNDLRFTSKSGHMLPGEVYPC